MMNATMMERIRRKTADAIDQLNEGKTAVEIAAELYRRNLPGKSERTAMMMAQHTADTVAEYYRSKAAAMEDYETWTNEALSAATEGMDAVQAYQNLYQIYVGAVAAAESNHVSSAEEKEAIRSRMNENAGRSFTAEEVSPEAMAELKEKLASALKDAGILTTQLDAILETVRNEDANAQMILDFGSMNPDIMTLLAMQTYLDAKNGLYPEIPANAQLEDITLSVCAAMDTYRVAAQVASGEITEEQGTKLLGVIGAVFGILVSIPIILTGVAFVEGLVFGILGMPLVALMAGIVSAIAISNAIIDPMSQAGTAVGNATQTLVVGTVKLVRKGLKLLIDTVSRGVKALRERIQGRQAEVQADAQTETEQAAQPVRQLRAAEASV